VLRCQRGRLPPGRSQRVALCHGALRHRCPGVGVPGPQRRRGNLLADLARHSLRRGAAGRQRRRPLHGAHEPGRRRPRPADLRAPGDIAFAFYGINTGDKDYGAWIAESRNALDPHPTYWAAAVNPPDKSMTGGAYADELSSGNEHIGLGFGPDGSTWASFTDGE